MVQRELAEAQDKHEGNKLMPISIYLNDPLFPLYFPLYHCPFEVQGPPSRMDFNY